jgi:oligoribonuclease
MERKLTTTEDPAWHVDVFAEQNGLIYDGDAIPSMVWVDTETTGLSKKGEDRTLELGMLLTDDDGVLVDVFQSFVTGSDWNRVIGDMSDFVREMHTASGFLDEREHYIQDSAFSNSDHREVQDRALGWLEEHGLLNQPNTYEMCGNSVWFDKRMLIQDMPALENWFFHRQIDVSTIKQLCKKHNPRIFNHYKKEIEAAIKPHRALLDIAASLREYRYYLENFLWVAK